jgi:hypothetical protein
MGGIAVDLEVSIAYVVVEAGVAIVLVAAAELVPRKGKNGAWTTSIGDWLLGLNTGL